MITINDITIVIVIYNSSALIFDCLKKLRNFKKIIVDNGKNSHIIDKLKKEENISIVSQNRNLGFGNAVNFAFNFIKSKYFLVLNPDIIIDEKTILKLLLTISKYENCAISAPISVSEVDSYGILPERRKLFLNKDKETAKIEPEGEFCVDVANGCALLINSKLFKEVDCFSPEYFLFWEEVDLCRKFYNKKYSVIINSNALAYHNQGKSSRQSLKNFFIREFYSELSPLYYFKIKKRDISIYKKMGKYLFRSITYLIILNFKNSIKNLAKMFANISYLIK
tara:strand:- start:3045 stop:3887 length:843 start_codon:yes stop_codon:yes gene_type:complete